MKTTLRLLLAVAGGVLATLVLFFVMHALVAGGGGQSPDPVRPMVDFVRVEPDEETIEKRRRKLPDPPPPEQQPPPSPQLPLPQITGLLPQPEVMAPPQLDLPDAGGSGPQLGRPGIGAADSGGDVVPLVQIAPLYPREARLRGTEGWVKIRFTIEADGSVADAVVVDAQPRRVFDREALRAIERWKFRPRMVAGKAVPREAEQVIEFEIDGD